MLSSFTFQATIFASLLLSLAALRALQARLAKLRPVVALRSAALLRVRAD